VCSRRRRQSPATTLTSFILEAAGREAERALVDRRLFLIDEARWDAFAEALDRPTEEKPRLRSLLKNPVDVR
jgi:uncharacterized protein (DUF1778 family)